MGSYYPPALPHDDLLFFYNSLFLGKHITGNLNVVENKTLHASLRRTPEAAGWEHKTLCGFLPTLTLASILFCVPEKTYKLL